MSRIKRLDNAVIEKIAAGENIQWPFNALKELLENAVDAQATEIKVTVRDGGLKLLQIADNGSGIAKEDLSILCHRYTTSKLARFDELQTVATYGFRGEALSSISQISNLEVVSKVEDSPVGYKAQYQAGDLKGDPQPVPRPRGTTIAVNDLFFNVPARARAIKSPSEETKRILEVMRRYAVHCLGVGFTLSKHGTSNSESLLFVKSTATAKERIRIAFGSAVANDLLEVSQEDPSKDLVDFGLLSFRGFVTNAGASSKTPIKPAIFINNRLVDCDPLRDGLKRVYSEYLPKSSPNFFAYLSLTINPAILDVNISPTKHRVSFHNADEIIDAVCDAVRSVLETVDSSRSFKAQTIVAAPLPVVSSSELRKSYDRNTVRLDHSQRQLKTRPVIGRDMISSTFTYSSTSTSSVSSKPPAHQTKPTQQTKISFNKPISSEESISSTDSRPESDEDDELPSEQASLTSIRQLKERVREQQSNTLTYIYERLSYIGVVDDSTGLVAAQSETSLLMINLVEIAKELFYQLALGAFPKYSYLRFEGVGLPMKELLRLEIQDDAQIVQCTKQLSDMSEMLSAYFVIDLEEIDGVIHLKTIPLLLDQYHPDLGALAKLVASIATIDKWNTDEVRTLELIMRALAAFHSTNAHRNENVGLLFDAFKLGFIATKIVGVHTKNIANTSDLFKVFERC